MAEGDKRDYRSLGEILRDAREDEELTLGELSQRTKISTTMIEALEADDLDRLVSPVYARSFLRSLAEALGLEADWLVTKYDNATASSGPTSPLPPSGQPSPENPFSPPAGATPPAATEAPVAAVDDGTTVKVEGTRVRRVKARRRSAGVPWPTVALGAGALAVVVLLVLLLPGALRGCGGDDDGDGVRLEDPRGASTPAEAGPGGLAAVEPAPDPPVEIPAGAAAPGARIAAPADGAADTGAREEETVDPPASSIPPPSSPGDATAAGEEVVRPPEGEAGMGSILRRPEGSTPVQLELKAVRRTDVWVGADGGERRRRTLGPGQVWQLSARDHFELLLPEPEAVEIRLDGVRREAPGRDRVFLLYPEPGP